MAFVKLNIVEPVNNLAVEGVDSVDFVGEIIEMPEELLGQSLYYRWYSSLYEPALDADDQPYYFSIEQNVQTQADQLFSWTPGLGSHAITIAVSDRATETLDDIKAIEHGGVAGGASDDPGPQCLIHIFNAVALLPEGDINNLPRNNLRLIAQAPSAWGEPPDEDYHEYNRLQYRWELVSDNFSGRRFSYSPEPEEMSFGFYSDFNSDIEPTTAETPNPADVFVVHFQPAQSDLNLLSSGGYTLKLHVEDKEQDENIGHDEDSFHITIA